MFLGEYRHAIDTKGRLFIPAKLREDLGEKFYICKGMDQCLMIYESGAWEKFTEKLNALPLTNKVARDAKRYFLAGASMNECDRQGRTLIPAALREYAGITRDVVIVGVGDKVEIWDEGKWNERSALSDKLIAEQLDDLKLDI